MKLSHHRQFLHLAASAAALPAISGIAKAQTYPSRPITIVVPFPAGGPADTLARILADHMRTTLAQTVIIENVSGASGSIGVGRVARAAPDGYTVSYGHWGTPLGGKWLELCSRRLRGASPGLRCCSTQQRRHIPNIT
jgi:tripartite-type tricarboxylate transporter receptor subunit TctC